MKVNDNAFVALRHDAVVAIVPPESLDALDTQLAAAGADPDETYALDGPEGVTRLDADGSSHSLAARIVRHMQALGAGQNERINYSDALRSGKDVVVVAAANRATALSYAQILDAAGAQRILYFGHHATEELS